MSQASLAGVLLFLLVISALIFTKPVWTSLKPNAPRLRLLWIVSCMVSSWLHIHNLFLVLFYTILCNWEHARSPFVSCELLGSNNFTEEKFWFICLLKFPLVLLWFPPTVKHLEYQNTQSKPTHIEWEYFLFLFAITFILQLHQHPFDQYKTSGPRVRVQTNRN